MRILIAGSQGQVGAALVSGLTHRHDVRTLDLAAGAKGSAPTFAGDPRDRDVVAEAVSGCETIILTPSLIASGAPPAEILDAATRGTYNLITQAPAARFILLTSLRTFEQYPMEWWVTEQWAPRPTTDVDELALYLAELVVREVARVSPVKAIALRLGEVVDDQSSGGQPADPRWLHVDDAVHAVECALAFEPAADGPQTGWWVFHIPGGGPRTRFPLGLAGSRQFGYAPRRDLTVGVGLADPPLPPPQPKRLDSKTGGAARRVVIFGAGGPLAAITTEALARDHILRLTDKRPLADIVARNRPQMPGAPLPRVLESPHEIQVVDVTDPEQVMQATHGMDAIINCAVVREQPAGAFRVNVVGVYNMMRAAVECNIRRFVQTGPPQGSAPHYPEPTNYAYDFDISPDVPARPGSDLYHLTKFLSQEICRIFAHAHGLEVPALVFSGLVNPAFPVRDGDRSRAWLLSWEDAGAAIRQALRVPAYPRPFEILHIGSDLPHGKFPNDKAKQLLQWQPRDRLEGYWQRNHGFAG